MYKFDNIMIKVSIMNPIETLHVGILYYDITIIEIYTPVTHHDNQTVIFRTISHNYYCYCH